MSDKQLELNLQNKYEETLVEIHFGDQILSYVEYFKIVGDVFYMITAANPFSNKLSVEANHLLNQNLKGDLLSRDLEIQTGVGRDPSSDWFEQGWVVSGVGEAELIELARKYQQNAIFRFDSAGQHVVNCR